MVAGSEVVSFNANVINLDGESENCVVTRVGLYNAICDGKYLEYIGSKGQYAFLGKQPEGRYVSSAKKLSKADVGEVIKFGVDPTGPVGGSLLANLIQNPSLMERVNQGREGIYYYICWLVGIAIAFWKLLLSTQWVLLLLSKLNLKLTINLIHLEGFLLLAKNT